MAERLSVIQSSELNGVKADDIERLIDKVIGRTKNNTEEICELTLECTAMLTSAHNKAEALKDQGLFKRLICDVTGKNRKLQNDIIQNNTNALYTAQKIINKVMQMCENNTMLLKAVNNRVNELHLEMSDMRINLSEREKAIREVVVAFYQKYTREIEEHQKRLKKIEQFEQSVCPKCGNDMLPWQRICTNCGNLHPLKEDSSGKATKSALDRLSMVLTSDTQSNDIIWDETARKTEAVLKKVKQLAEIGQLSNYPSDLKKDIDELMKKCRDVEFQIAIVGIMKSGKSMLMNALIGAEIASVDVNPETAALTRFRSANGYYVIVRFHSKEQWRKLRQSVLANEKTRDNSKNRDSFSARLNDPKLKEKEAKLIGSSPLRKECKDLEELRAAVKKYTSSKYPAHILVSDIEVGIDQSIFNMPKEVVFVDTPGLEDPVKYRSDITEGYIKTANAVLIAVTPGALDKPRFDNITSVLKKAGKEKVVIVGTQIDKDNQAEDRLKYLKNWKENLINSGLYRNERDIAGRVILTSARIELLMKRWDSLSTDQKRDPEYFSDADFRKLRTFAEEALNVRQNVDLENLSPEARKKISETAGISVLSRKLEQTLIKDRRKLKVAEITEMYKRCREQIINISSETVAEKERFIEDAKAGAERIKLTIAETNKKKATINAQTAALKNEADKLAVLIQKKIDKLRGEN